MFQAAVTVYPKIVARKSAPYYPKGSRITDTSDLSFHGGPKTVLLITASTCHFCAASVDFHGRVASAVHAAGGRVVAVTHEDLAPNKAFLKTNGISVDTVLSDVKSGIQIRGTPTLVIVDGGGKVIGTWAGKLSAEKEQDVMSAISKRS